DGRTSAAERLPADAAVRLLDNPPKAGSLQTASRLRAVLRRESPDLVLTYSWGAIDALLAAVTLGYRRVVHHEEGFNADEAESFKKRRIYARRLLLPRAHRVVVPSERLLRIATGLWRLHPERVRMIPNGIHLDAYSPADGNPELRQALRIPAAAPVVGSCGHLRPVKNYLRLLEAAAAVDPRYNLHVLLVGEGEERAALEARAARPDLAGRVHLVGYQADPAPYYRAMDLFALTSDSEQMPVCLLEAMASCLPVVATDVGDVRTMLPPEQAGLLVPLAGEGTAARLGHHLEEALADGDLRLRLGLANRRRVAESYAFESMCIAYRGLYEEALLKA
ncbi:MAG TPA: glycosyltransferase, partial [Thermoanaerobaculia bacterium]|nr:glycosyltransferase [Thermoanaerobaculia bacterium]